MDVVLFPEEEEKKSSGGFGPKISDQEEKMLRNSNRRKRSIESNEQKTAHSDHVINLHLLYSEFS